MTLKRPPASHTFTDNIWHPEERKHGKERYDITHSARGHKEKTNFRDGRDLLYVAHRIFEYLVVARATCPTRRGGSSASHPTDWRAVGQRKPWHAIGRRHASGLLGKGSRFLVGRDPTRPACVIVGRFSATFLASIASASYTVIF
ncbi:unnamed protein product [Calypogeia fissa]